MSISKIFRLTLAAVSLISLSSFAQAREGGISDGGGMAAPSTAACDGLDGATFVSVNEYEMGLGPNGVLLGHYRVTFSAGQFDYSLSDFGLNGTFSCSGPEGAIVASRDDFPLDGFYKADAGILLWHERWFRLER